jgi:hypothetical protein
MEIVLLKEPLVEFANKFLCDDPKKGIMLEGFYSLTNNSHRSEIHYSIIGTNQNIEDLKKWIKNLDSYIEATASEIKIKNEVEIEDGEIQTLFDYDEIETLFDETPKTVVNKKLNPDFPGFGKNSVFKCEFLNDETNNFQIKKSRIEEILKEKAVKKIKLSEIIEIYQQAYLDLVEFSNTLPDICFIVIPTEVYKKLGSIPYGNFYLNFRRKLKASLIACNKNVPVQLILEDTISGTKKEMQDMSMVAWNFVVAQYYKTENCIPWSLSDIDKDTCFIGISFHKILDSESRFLRSSIAQAFNREGKGLVFTGKQFEWNSSKTKVTSPHLNYAYAKDLIKTVLENYIRINRHTPSRVVIHKTTDFWDAFKNPDFAEIDGLQDGINEILSKDTNVDYVTIKSAYQKVFRAKGEYPVMRGTLLKLDDFNGVLYTTGYIPYYESYPGVHIPLGLHIEIIGDSTLNQICKEILALTKLNFNNCNYYDSLPITLKFSQKVGEIIQYLPDNIDPPIRYYYYM